ncbi:hypothetical protein [Microlunatus flavus]|uniref:Predicted acetyltransferase, GNAT superfamily n=1 Tax=Microlunatus flavus TaxID=1036181 RepID=A0A1H9I4X3_9ACTN|nr:hypothetical protein [Microlunatus flavus]SEQ69634.1 Predicted acetyltransferase, GNAT superfamily [Microlunatus flavus]
MASLLSRLTPAAEAAAREAGVEVRDLRGDEMAAASALYAEVWGLGPQESPMEPGLLVALGFAGSYVSGAFDADGTLVGSCAGFLGTAGAGHPLLLHSHIAAVRPGSGRGIGTALKLHQRAWCAGHGVATIGWTYDPLIARNAWFNLGRLGAHVETYLVDFYGRMDDGLNAGEESDRLLVHWPVDPDEVHPAAPDEGRAHAALAVGGDGGPVAHPAVPVDAAVVTLAVPHDVEALRRSDRAVASRWRSAFRDAYADLHEQGWRVRRFAREGRYVLGRTTGSG